MHLTERPGRLLALLALAVLVAYPLLTGTHPTSVMTQALLFALLAISVDLLWGYAGILNLAPAAFFGLGAYAYAMSQRYFAADWAAVAGLGLAVIAPMLLGLLVGYVAFRARSTAIYFALITLAVGIAVERLIAVSTEITGGSNGLTGIRRPSLFGLAITDSITYFYFVLVVVVLLYFLSTRIVGSPFGRALAGIRESESRAQSVGYDTTRYKLAIIAISASLAGIAGALTVPIVSMAHPTQLSVLLSLQAYVWVAVGGQGTLVGPFAGAVVINLLESWLSGALVWAYLLILGVVFVLIVIFMPGGVAGAIQRISVIASTRHSSYRADGAEQAQTTGPTDGESR